MENEACYNSQNIEVNLPLKLISIELLKILSFRISYPRTGSSKSADKSRTGKARRNWS